MRDRLTPTTGFFGTRRLLGVLGAAALAVLVVAPASPQARESGPRRTVYVAKETRTLPNTSFVRTRDCIGRPRTCVNGVAGRDLVYLTKGQMPRRATTATVLTDTDCAADHNGISHCSNILRLVSGRRITVRHDHSMMNDRCLSPGEHVRVRPIG